MTNILKGEQVRLTAITKDDLSTFAKWYQDTDFMRQMDAVMARPKTADSFKKWQEEAQSDENRILFAIRPCKDDTLIGYVEFEGILWNQQTAWLAIGIGDPAHQNKGYGREAMQLTLKFAFHELNLRRVQLTVFAYNERAVALYEKIGFVREGAFREFLHRDGQLYDMYFYGLLRREWETQQQ